MKLQHLPQLTTLAIIILTIVSFLAPPVEADCNPPNCTGVGQCDLTTNICDCQDPWTGPGCEGRDACLYTDSKDGSYLDRDCHHGRCETVNEDTGEYRCVCEEGFMQPDCALRDACKLDPDLKPYEDPTTGPCHNGGKCTAAFKGDTSTFSCACPKGFLPPDCEFEDPCVIKEGGNHSHPCTSSKRGTCSFLLDKKDRNRPIKKCKCNRGYLGAACGDTDPCEFEETNKCVYRWVTARGPRETKHKCTRVSNTEMSCTCRGPQFLGASCSQLDACKAPRTNASLYPPFNNPCRHNQPCQHKNPSNFFDYRCLCKGYHGRNCQFVNGEIIFIPAGSDKVVSHYNVSAGREYTYYVVILKIVHPDNTTWQVHTGDQGQLLTSYKVRHFRPISELQDEKVKAAVEKLRIEKKIDNEEPMYFLPFHWTYLEGDYSLSLVYKLIEGTSRRYPTYQTDTISISSTLPPGLACIPTTKLSDVSHDPETAVEYRRTTHFVISVELMYGCLWSKWLESKLTSHHDKRFHFQWRMYKLTRDFNARLKYNDWHIEKFATNSTDHKYIEFKPHVLLEGLYWIECKAYVHHDGMDYGHSDLGFFRIVNDPPHIELVGGSHRTVDWNEDIVLDASQSTDESFPEDSDNLHFEWICMSPCDKGKWTGPVITIPKQTFQPNSVIKIFLRVKSSHAKNEASESITLNVKKQVTSVIQCIRNCHHDFSPGDDVVFRCHYTVNGVAGPPEHIKWSWVPEHEIYPEEVEDEPYLTSVTIPRVPDVGDRFLICTATPPNTAEPIISRQEIKINQPPVEASCSVEPTTGDYLVTTFSITCQRFTTVYTPVVYSFYAEVPGDLELVEDLQDRLLFDHDTNAEVTDAYLPYGNPNSNWTLNIIVEATDSRGLSSEVALPVVVTRPNASSNVEDLLDDLVYKNDSLMRRRIYGGNIQGGLQLQMLAMFELDDQRFPSTIPREKRYQLLSTIAQDLHENHPNVFKEMQQIVNVMHLLVQIEDRINNKEVFVEVSELMMETTAKLAEDVHNPLEVTPTEDKDNIVNTTVDSGSRIFSTATELGEQAKTNVTLNIREVTEFIEEDETKDTFSGLIANHEKFDKDNYDDVSETAEQDVKDYCNVAKHALTSLSHSADAAAADLAYDETYDTATEDVSIHAEILSRNTSDVNVTMKTLQGTDEMRVEVNIAPEIIEAAVNTTDGDLELQITEVKGNPHCDDPSANPNTPFVSVVLKDPDSHNQIPLVELEIPLEISLPVSRPISQMELDAGKSKHFPINIVPPEELDEYSTFPRFKINLPYNAEIGIEISDVSSPSMIFRVLALKNRRPRLRDFCERETIETDQKGYTATFKSELIGLNEKPEEPYLEYYVGILAFDDKNPFTIQHFSIVFTRPACVRRNDDGKFWSENGCMVKETQTSSGGKSTELERITCLCNHFSLFAGVHFVIPHTVEDSNPFTDFTVVNLEEYPVVLITVCVLLVLYVLGFILCRYLDLRDERTSLGLTIMADLKESSWERYYLITVLTGTYLWAGTSSCVCMVMYGSNGRSQIYTLKDKDLTVFRRGAADTFLVGCNKDLGTLEKIRIWTDHTGHDPAWYCRKILIRHIATDQEWFFYVNRWLTVTAEESTVILEIPATVQEEQKKFFVRFKENLSDQFENAKLWISIFRYSPNSTFTRCQRLSSAFAMLSFYLMLDILAVGTVTEDENGLFEFGVYTIDFYAILKSSQLVLFALPFGIIVVGLFRNILPKTTPTLVIWKNVASSKTEFGNKLFIPTVHGISKHRPPKRESVSVEIDDDEEGGDNYDEQDEADHNNRYSWIQPKVGSGNMNSDNVSISSSSTFSIPSTDIPMLEGWIDQRIRHQDGGLDSDEDYEDGMMEEDRFVFNLDMGSEYDESHEANQLARLGRRALTHAVRQYDPDAFIFKGEHDIRTLEELIDKRILEGNRPAYLADKKEETNGNRENDNNSGMTPEAIADVDVEPIKKKSKISSIFKKIGRKAKTPWKEVVTSEYLQKIDESLENELESREAVQNKEVPPEIEVALELCLLPRIIKPRFSWPWWFIFIAWFVCLSSIAGSSAFTIIFGIHYGFLRSMRWVENFLGSVFISNLVVQPLNAVAGAFLWTMCGKRLKLQEMVQVVIESGDNSALLNSRKPYNFSVFRAFRTYEPLAGHQIFRLKIEARRRKELRSKLLRLLLSILLLVPLIAFSYSGRFSQNYGITRNIRNLFQLNGLREEQVVHFSDQEMVHDYLENVLIKNLHPENDFSGNLLKESGPQFLSDQQTVLIGVPRIRQHRVKSSECQEEDNLFRKCIRHQSFKKTTQDRLSYHQKWVPVPAGSERLPQSENNDCWEFHDAGNENSSKTLSLTFRGHQGQYDGGGYIVELGRNRRDSLNILKFIRRHKWMDEHTRAIFVEFTLLNPNMNKFVDVVILIEQGATWYYSVKSWINPIEFIPLDELSEISDEIVWLTVSMLVIVIVLIIKMYLFIRDIFVHRRPRLFRSANIWLDLVIIVFTIVSVGLSLHRLVYADEISSMIESQRLDEYVNIQRAVYWDDVQRTMFSITLAFVYMKTLKLMMSTDKRFLSFALTVKLTYNYVAAFFLIITILITAFAYAGFLIFGQEIFEFSTWGESMVTLVDQILDFSFIDEFADSHPFFGRVFSSAYGFFIVFVSFNFIVALLEIGVQEAKEVVQQRRNWLTFARYFKTILFRTFPTLDPNYKKKRAASHIKTLPPDRLHAMKQFTIDYLRSFLIKSGHYRMKEMQEYANKVLDGTGYKVVSKRHKVKKKIRVLYSHIEELREITTNYFRERLGHDMKPEELKEYADFNEAIVKIRIQKMEKKVEQLETKIDEFVSSITPDSTEDSNRNPSAEADKENKEIESDPE